MLTFIINGTPGSGKDTFVDIFKSYWKYGDVYNFSSVDRVKEAAKILGWDSNVKTEKDRKFLSDLKSLSDSYNDQSFNLMTKQYKYLENNGNLEDIIFYHIREPHNIERLKNELKCNTILVRRNDSENYIHDNESDSLNNILAYDYDIVINNNGTIADFENEVRYFALSCYYYFF